MAVDFSRKGTRGQSMKSTPRQQSRSVAREVVVSGPVAEVAAQPVSPPPDKELAAAVPAHVRTARMGAAELLRRFERTGAAAQDNQFDDMDF